jgi:hypothetical protein
LKPAIWQHLAVLAQLVCTLPFPRQWVRFVFFHATALVGNIFIYLTWYLIDRDCYNFVSRCCIYETKSGLEVKIRRINSWREDCFTFCTNTKLESVFVLQNCSSQGFV